MSTEQPWGSEPALVPTHPRPRWSGRKTLAAVGIAVVIAAGGGAAIWAATAHDTDQRPGYGGPGMPGGPGGSGDGRFPALGALDNALHGEFVIADGSTELLQTGKVTQVSATSIDVTSTDGYAHSYTINNATRSTPNLKTGDQVTVIAKKSDNTALTVLNRTNVPPDGRRRPPTSTTSAPPTT
jgi:hypothetical protein